MQFACCGNSCCIHMVRQSAYVCNLIRVVAWLMIAVWLQFECLGPARGMPGLVHCTAEGRKGRGQERGAAPQPPPAASERHSLWVLPLCAAHSCTGPLLGHKLCTHRGGALASCMANWRAALAMGRPNPAGRERTWACAGPWLSLVHLVQPITMAYSPLSCIHGAGAPPASGGSSRSRSHQHGNGAS
jgi:hypothetical protein